MNGFPITHLVIHPGRLGTQKHVQVCSSFLYRDGRSSLQIHTDKRYHALQAKAMPGVFVVTPEWVFKCARTWERASEKDFLADEWKAKQERAALAAQEAAVADRSAAEVPEGSVVSVVPVAAQVTEARPSESNEPEQAKTPGDGDAQEEKVAQTLSSSESADAAVRKKKNVSFAASVAGGDEETKEGDKPVGGGSRPSASSLRQRRVPVRRVIGGGRVGSSVIPERKGVVASGGTFDFLSKITRIGAAKREQKPAESTSKQAVDTRLAAKQEPAKSAPAKVTPVLVD